MELHVLCNRRLEEILFYSVLTLQGNALLSSLSDSFFPLQSLYYNLGHKNTVNPKISLSYIYIFGKASLKDSCEKSSQGFQINN